jgi:hypothetical protein
MAEEQPLATVYKSPDCGCCNEYVSYLRSHGFPVETVNTGDLLSVNRQHSLPQQYAGCHTTLIDGYAVSGHVPVTVLERLLTERPSVDGITLPGMPQGSPGMSGTKQKPFEIYEFRAGDPYVRVYAVE